MGQGVFRKLPSGNEEWGRGIPTNPNLHKFGEQDEEELSEMKIGTRAKRSNKTLIFLMGHTWGWNQKSQHY